MFGTAVHAVLRRAGPGAAEPLGRHLAREGVTVRGIERVEPSLEDVFLEVVSQEGA